MLVGKLHAILARRYVKGRDIYDLIWYLAGRSWPQPNIELLNNALGQTEWRGPEVTKSNWRSLLQEKAETLKWARVVEDVQPFLEHPEDVNLLTKENLVGLLRK